MAKRLLVIDDDPGLLLAVSGTLRAEGYDLKTARRGAEALVIIAQSLPDLIISDIRMPGMDGSTSWSKTCAPKRELAFCCRSSS